MCLIFEIQLFPCLDYIKKITEVKHIKIEKYEYFQKRTFRNRYIIAGANGLSSFTIPVAGGREQKTLITEIEIDNTTDWRIKHWRSIVSAYRKAPFYDYYAEEIRMLLFNPEKKLFNFNFSILNNLIKMLNVNVLIDFTDVYSSHPSHLDYRNKCLPRFFQDDTADWQPVYSQVFEDRWGFQPNLSVLDLLFCEGPNSGNLLDQSINHKT